MKVWQLTLEDVIPWRLTGPILDKELRVCSRRKRYYWLRGLYLLAMAMLVLVTWLGSSASFRFQGNAFSASRMAVVGRTVIISIIWFQFFIAQIAAILFFSNSICEEMNQGTLNVLMATPITSLQIVMGKLLSRLLQLILILCLSLSTIAIVYVFGGVHWEYIMSTFFITLTSVVFMGTFTLFLSGMVKRPYSVIILMLTFICVYYMIGSAVFQAASANTGQWILMFNPLNAMIEATSPKTGTSTGFAWWIHCMTMIGISAILVLLTVVRLRKTMLSFAFERNIERKGLIGRIKRLLVGRSVGYPIRLKGLPNPYAKSNLFRAIFAVLLVAGLLFAGFVFMIDDAEALFMALWIVFGTIFTLLCMVVGTRTMVCAATAITKEKENRTLVALLTTPLTDAQIINGKLKDICQRNYIGWLLILAISVIAGILVLAQQGVSGGESVIAIGMAIPMLLSIISSLFFIICFGLFISVRVKNSTIAIVVVLGGFLGWYFVSNIVLIIPTMIGMAIFPFITPVIMVIGRLVINTFWAFFFLWQAKESIRKFAAAK